VFEGNSMETGLRAGNTVVLRLPVWLLRSMLVIAGLALVAAAAGSALRDFDAQGESADPPATLGRMFGLVAAMLLMIQFAMSARLRILDRAFGLDVLLRCHAATGAAAGVFAALHPFLVFAGEGRKLGPLHPSQWPVLLGAAVLTALCVVICTSLWRAFLDLPHGSWRIIHWLTFVVVAGAAVHALVLGSDLVDLGPRIFWIVVIGAYAALFVWAKIVKPVLLRRHPWTVKSVTQVSHNTWNLELIGPTAAGLRYLPGQFAFLRPHHRGMPSEEHPFTLSSSPSRGDTISFTIKESGDYTDRIGEIQLGDAATVEGPFGRFSHLLHREGPLLMIAGGVGITPLLSMLRFLAEAGDKRPVTLICANRTQRDILFRDELEAMTETLPQLVVHHVLSNEPGHRGLTGYVDRALLERILSDTDCSARVFLCGPPPMMTLVADALRKLGFPRRRIHTERFSL